MSQETKAITENAIEDLQGLEIETFKIDELDNLGVDAAAAQDISISLCSSTTSSSCG